MTAKTTALYLPSAFRSLRHRNYRLWFFGQTVSLVGTWMQTMAQQVLVYRLTGSATSLGIISFIGLLPVIPFSLWGGSIADRFPRRTIILIAQVIMMLQAFILAGLTGTGRVQLWHVYLLALFLAAANAVDLPARQAFTVDMVEGKEDLTNAIGLNSAMFNAARAIGPALAGLAVAATGEAWAFLLNGLSFLAVIISLLFMHNLPPVRLETVKAGNIPLPVEGTGPVKTTGPVKSTGRGNNTLAHMAGGIKFVAGYQTVMVMVSLVAVSAFLSMPYTTLLPVFAKNVLAASAAPFVVLVCGAGRQCQSPEALPLGALYTVVGVGAVIGALYVASLKDQAQRGRLLTLGNLTFPILLLLFAISRSFLFSLVLMCGIGFSFVLQNALANTLLQFLTPDELRGRVMSVYTLVFQVMMRMGGLQSGLVADWAGAHFAVGVGALVSLGYGLFVALRYPAIRRL